MLHKDVLIPSIAVIFLMDIFVCHEVFHHLDGVVIVFVVLKTYIFFLCKCVLIPPNNTSIVMVCYICNVTYSIRGQCGPHKTIPVCS